MATQKGDVVIVGVGAAGAILAAELSKATLGPNPAVRAAASAGPAAPVTAYARLSKALARSQSRLGTIRGSNERAPLLLTSTSGGGRRE